MSTQFPLLPYIVCLGKISSEFNSMNCELRSSSVLIQPTVGIPLKRPYQSSGLDDKDFENIDPALVLPSSKRVKYGFDHITQLHSPYSVLTATQNTTTLRKKYPLPSTRRIAQVHNPAPISTTPVSKHAEVVRVSTSRLPRKRSGHLSVHQKTTWINPPYFSNVSAQGVSQPSLLDVFLSDAVTSSLSNLNIKPLHMRDITIPAAWFNIHEDTKDEEMGNLLIHSATTLDISDDKAGINAKANRGMEDVLSTDSICAVYAMSTAASSGRKNLVTDRTRTSLGNLDIAEFCAEGCDVESCFILPAEMGEEH